jgi:tetratricopeptide (TPR) repeat protein
MDPMSAFRADLRGLRKSVGDPSVRHLGSDADLADVGQLPKSTISELLNGPGIPRWPTVRAFVRACEYHAEHHLRGPRPSAEFDLVRWQGLYEVAVTAQRNPAGHIPRQPLGFQLRSDLLRELERAGPGVSVVYAVTGMLGVGKTQLVAAYARQKAVEGWRLVGWVDAGDRRSLLAGFAEVAEAVRLDVHDAADAGMAVKRWLEVNGNRCLVVLDNATDADALQPYIPAFGDARVVITSNRQSVARLGTSIEVDVFTAAEALAFLTGLTGLDDPGGADAVATELGYLPLALAQAAAVIHGQRLPYETYLDRLRKLRVRQYLVRADGEPYRRGVAQAILLSLDAVQDRDQNGVSIRVLELMAVLSAAGVRRDLLYNAGRSGALDGTSGTAVSDVLVDEALHRLVEQSLLTFSLDGQTAIVHRLVLRVVRDELAEAGRLLTSCELAASQLKACADDLEGSQDRRAQRDFPEQVTALQAVVAGLSREPEEELARMLLSLRYRAVWCLHELGDSRQQVVSLGEQLVADCRDFLGADYFTTWLVQDIVGRGYVAGGRVAQAVLLHAQALFWMERQLGPDDPGTIAVRSNLAIAYRAAGRFGEAVALSEQALEAHESVLGPDHPGTMSLRSSLAHAYQSVGRIDEAIALFEQVLAVQERRPVLDVFDTLQVRNNLACALRAARRIDEAITVFELTLRDRERLLGVDHPSTLQTRGNLATTYKAAGRFAEAIPLMQQVLSVQVSKLGPDHPNSLATRNNLATATQEAGRVADAIPLLEQTVEGFSRVLGDRHPDTLTARHNLAEALRGDGQIAEAIALHERNHPDIEDVLGAGDHTTWNSRDHLAEAYMAVRRADDAIPLLQRVIADRQRILGSAHDATLASLTNLAVAQRAAGRLDDAISLLIKVLDIQARLNSQNSFRTAQYLGTVYEEAGQFDKAVPLYEIVVDALERAGVGPIHPQVASVRSSLADALLKAGRVDEALTQFESCHAIFEQSLGPNDPTTERARRNLEAAIRDSGRNHSPEACDT